MDLRIATCKPMPEPDPDEAPLLAKLAERGLRARVAAWNDPAEDWDAPVPTVLRSTWDYHLRLEAFLAWIERVGERTTLWNPPAVVRWNAHKFYLQELAREGFPIVPTAFLARASSVLLREVSADHGWDEVVVKPAVSGGSWATERVHIADAEALRRGERHLATLLAERDVLVQRYAPAVETSGERCLVWIDGELTHAVRKAPRFSGQEESVYEVPIAADERALAARLLERFRDPLLYARVDLVRDGDGQLGLMELELLEPSLFLVQHPPALERLVGALKKRLV